MSISSIRKDYQLRSLSESEVHASPVAQFSQWWDEAIASEIDEVNAMTLSTITTAGRPSARIVLLKGFDEKGFVFYTNYHSDKGTSIEHHAKVGLAFFWPPLERQVIIKGEAVKLSSQASDSYFKSRPKGSQIGAIVSDQSKVISDRSIMEAKLEALEIEYAEKEVPRPEHWGGYVVKPQCIEFWQGRPNRLHDRMRCQLQGNFWNIERLAP